MRVEDTSIYRIHGWNDLKTLLSPDNQKIALYSLPFLLVGELEELVQLPCFVDEETDSEEAICQVICPLLINI